MENKKCNKCNLDKESHEFNKLKSSKDGLQSKCKTCTSEYNKNRYLENSKIFKERAKQWKENNPERRKEISKNWASKNYYLNIDTSRIKNREANKKAWGNKTNEQKKSHYKKNNDNRRKRCKNNPLEDLKHAVRSSISMSIKRGGYTKKSNSQEILGCSYEEFKLHIETQFKDWMSWDNRGLYNGTPNYGWDVDHIIPVSSGITEEDVINLNHYTNLQPLCSYINREIKRDNS
jgi:hypothetical protein